MALRRAIERKRVAFNIYDGEEITSALDDDFISSERPLVGDASFFDGSGRPLAVQDFLLRSSNPCVLLLPEDMNGAPVV